jgi:hypothetical protein
VLVAAVAGCGDRPVKPPDVTRLKPTTPKVVLRFPAAGVTFKAPRGWGPQRSAQPPRVTAIYSGNSLVAVWAYPRTKEVLPQDPASFKAGRTRLLKEVHKRDPKFVVTSTEPRKIAGAPALQIVGRQTIARLPLLTRSVHVYKGHVEYVIEALAPPSQYAVTNREVLTPLLESLKLTGKIRKRSKG